MKIVLSKRQMQHLKKMGIDTSHTKMALIYTNSYDDIVDWEIADDGEPYWTSEFGEFNPYLRSKYGVFTISEILDLLPDSIKDKSYTEYFLRIERNKDLWKISYSHLSNDYEPLIHFESDELIDICYDMLCWHIENKEQLL